MGGFLGIGGSSAQTDRGNQLAATQGDWSIFNYGLPTGQAAQTSGTGTLDKSLSTLDTAKGTLNAPANYFQSLLGGGRTQAAQMSAPAVNATLAGSDAQKQQQNNFGTGRTGGMTAASANRDTATGSSIDNIINTTLQTGRDKGAAGLTQVAGAQANIGTAEGGIGGEQLANALSLLGLSSGAVNSILSNATGSKQNDPNVGLSIGKGIGELFMAAVLGA